MRIPSCPSQSKHEAGHAPSQLLLGLLCVVALTPGTAVVAQGPTEVEAQVEAIRAFLNAAGDSRQAELRARDLLRRVEQAPHLSPALISSIDVLVESILAGSSDATRGTGGGRAPETLSLAQRAVEAARGAFGPDDRRTAYSQTNLGVVQTARLEFKTAVATLQEALGTLERSMGAQDPATARTRLALGGVLRAAGEFEKSRGLIEWALRSYEQTLPTGDARIALALVSLSATVDRLGQTKAANAHLERAAPIIRTTWGPEHPLLAQIIGNLAWGMDQAGEFRRSGELHRESIALYERSVGGDHPALAWELNNYGLLYWRTGDYAGGQPLFERALKIWTKADSPDASRALNNLAITFRRLGDQAAARSYYARSLAIKEKTYGPDHPEVALVLFNTANLLSEMGDYADARRLYERTLQIREEKLGRSHTLTAYALNGLGKALAGQRQRAAARPYLERAVAIWQRLDAVDVAIGLSSLGDVSRDAGRFDAALRYYDRARATYEKTFGADYADVAVLDNSAAGVLLRQGRYEDARGRYGRALTAMERQFGPDYPALAEVAAGLGTAHWVLGDTAEARRLALRSERLGREHFRLTSRTLSEREALEFSGTRAPALDLLMTMAVDGPTSADDWRQVADAVVRGRALVLDELSRRRRFRAATSPAQAAADGRLTNARGRLANLIVRGPGSNPAEYSAALTTARLERDAAERELAAIAADVREELDRDHAGLEDILGTLPADTAVVSFVKYQHVTRGSRRQATSANAGSGEWRYAALVLRGGSRDVSGVPLGRAASLDALVARWRGHMSRVVQRGAGTVAEGSYRRTAGALTRALWSPVAARVAGASQLFLVPDGSMNLVSFAALPDDKNGYLVETGPLLHYLSAERDLMTPAAPAQQGGLLALGNPAYNGSRAAAVRRGADTGCPDLQGVRFGPLPSTLGEVDDVVSLWGTRGADVLRLTGEQATETAFKQNAPRSRVIHLATHGFFVGLCGPSGADARGVGGVYTAILSPRLENPLALSGLALAGANRRGAGAADDGILTAEEVAGLDLAGVEWAVLSACDTGVGEVRAGEGVFGLRRAFTAAGARTTIMSLWSVGDRSTREWMKALYEARLSRNRSTAEALRDASRAILRGRRDAKLDTHPYFWAAFVAAGDWR